MYARPSPARAPIRARHALPSRTRPIRVKHARRSRTRPDPRRARLMEPRPSRFARKRAAGSHAEPSGADRAEQAGVRPGATAGWTAVPVTAAATGRDAARPGDQR
ncbi:hypothetical protein GCM10023334_048170 [Nonomuraea thailandensis]